MTTRLRFRLVFNAKNTISFIVIGYLRQQQTHTHKKLSRRLTMSENEQKKAAVRNTQTHTHKFMECIDIRMFIAGPMRIKRQRKKACAAKN